MGKILQATYAASQPINQQLHTKKKFQPLPESRLSYPGAWRPSHPAQADPAGSHSPRLKLSCNSRPRGPIKSSQPSDPFVCSGAISRGQFRGVWIYQLGPRDEDDLAGYGRAGFYADLSSEACRGGCPSGFGSALSPSSSTLGRGLAARIWFFTLTGFWTAHHAACSPSFCPRAHGPNVYSVPAGSLHTARSPLIPDLEGDKQEYGASHSLDVNPNRVFSPDPSVRPLPIKLFSP
ncbi:hypothetical protein PtB15_3B478 [Puccinia triticina]|nr:hypothetical protein PtB15_3B478 [Puccinia triticina]